MLTTVPLGHHLHIGAHDLYPTLVKRIFAEFPEFFDEHLIDLISPQQLRGVLRKTDPRHGVQLSDLQHLETRQDCLRAVISGHGLLCSQEKITSIHGFYGTLTDSLSALARIFSNTFMTIHLVITPQVTYAPMVDATENFGSTNIWQKPEMLSWQSLIQKIQMRFPSAPIIVWPIEDPVDQAAEFISGLTALPFDKAQRKQIQKIAAEDRFARARTQTLDENLEILLDAIYEDDLAALKTMPNVQLGMREISQANT